MKAEVPGLVERFLRWFDRATLPYTYGGCTECEGTTRRHIEICPSLEIEQWKCCIGDDSHQSCCPTVWSEDGPMVSEDGWDK